MMDRNLRGDVWIRIVREVFAQRIGEPNSSGLYELKNRSCRKHLVHRAEAKASIDRVRQLRRTIGQAVSAVEDFVGGPVFNPGHEGGASESFGRGVLLELGA